jgi:hypothetical protein
MLDPAFQSFAAVSACRPPENYDIKPGAVFAELKAIAAAVTSGDARHPETIAVAQATALNVMFGRLTELAMANPQNPSFHSTMGLAFRAQAQCVRALETLSTLRNPSIFAHQLNLANQQIVQNTAPVLAPPPVPPPRPAEALDSRQHLPADPNLVRLAEPLIQPIEHPASRIEHRAPNLVRSANRIPAPIEPPASSIEHRANASPIEHQASSLAHGEPPPRRRGIVVSSHRPPKPSSFGEAHSQQPCLRPSTINSQPSTPPKT